MAAQRATAGNELAVPTLLTTLTDLPGTIGGRDTADYYAFTAPAAAMQLTVTTAATSERAPYFVIESADARTVVYGRVTPGATQSFPFEAVAGQQYRIVVSEGPASYVFSVVGA